MRTRAPLLTALVLLGRAAGAYASSAYRRTASRGWWSTVARRGTVCPSAWMPGRRRRLLASVPLVWVLLWLWCAGVARATLVYVQPAGTLGSLPPHRGEILAAGDDGARPRALAHGFSPVISPNGRLIAFMRYQGDREDLWTMGVKGDHQRRVLRGAGGEVTWFSDSRRLAVDRDPSVGIVTVRDRRVVDFTEDASHPSFAPDGRQLVARFGFRGSGLELLDPRKPRKSRDLGLSGNQPLWGKPGIAFVRGSAIVLLRRPRPGARGRVLFDDRRSGGHLLLAAWSQAGNRLLVGVYTLNSMDEVSPIEPVLIDARRGTVLRLPQPLSALYAVSRNGHTVLGQMGNDVVLERADGTIKILAHNADSATWTA